ncbi:MAG TPA: NAD-dependent epimerase/dehydratase family protein, partial [Vicinamibacterales bacterium]|nr:NAD-dependent epimerase/dehydratase family protein [Vicinamibacterales bacterium]
MNRVFVTGGTGFIGSRLVARLVGAGVSVRVLTRNPSARIGDVDVVHGDICDFDTVARACEGTDTVFHLAGTAHDRAARGDWTRHRVVAVDGARTVIEAAHRAGASRFVFASSLAVFGPVEGGPHDEETPARPASPYGRAKLEAEDVLRTAAARMGMHVAVLRPAMVYGPHCRGNLPRLIRLVDRRFCPQVPDYGTRRSVVHVDHVVEALMLAACRTQAAGQTYIVADKE